MKKIIVVGVLMFFFFGCGNRVTISCTEFETDIEIIEGIVEKVNQKNNSMNCTHINTAFIAENYNHPEDASKIWSLYNFSQKMNIYDKTFNKFLNEYFVDAIGKENCDLVLSEVKSWLNDPRMQEHIAKQIKESLESMN